MGAVGSKALCCVTAGKIDSGATVSVCPGHGQRQLAGARIAVSTGLTPDFRLQKRASRWSYFALRVHRFALSIEISYTAALKKSGHQVGTDTSGGCGGSSCKTSRG